MSVEDVVIRAFDIDRDLTRWTEIHNDPRVARDVLRIPYGTPEFWRSRLADSTDRHRMLVAEADGMLVGGIGFSVYEGRRAHVGTLGMAVDVAYQRRGIGSRLLESVLDLADNWYRLQRVELEVYVDNAAGIALYEKFGFEIEGTMRQYAVQDGRFVDAYKMARLRETDTE